MADVGSIYAETGRDIASHISSAFQRLHAEHQKEEDARQRVQGVLDAAKTIQVNDPKTGKPKPFFSPDQVQTVQHLLDLHKAAQAGAMAAGMGMGANALARIRQQQALAGGPVSGHLPDGTPIIVGPTGAAHTYVPRNQQGQTANSILTQNRQAQIANSRNAFARQQAFDAQLKQAGVNRFSLFNQGEGVEGGKIVNGKFILPGQDMSGKPVNAPPPDPNEPDGGKAYQAAIAKMVIPVTANGNFDQNQITEYRLGKRDPDPKGATPALQAGSTGHFLSKDDYQGLQDQAIYMGDPNLQRNKMWLESNKDSPDYADNLASYRNQIKQARAVMDPAHPSYNPEYRAQVLSAGARSGTDTTLNLPSAVPEGTTSTEGMNQAPPQDEQPLEE